MVVKRDPKTSSNITRTVEKSSTALLNEFFSWNEINLKVKTARLLQDYIPTFNQFPTETLKNSVIPKKVNMVRKKANIL